MAGMRKETKQQQSMAEYKSSSPSCPQSIYMQIQTLLCTIESAILSKHGILVTLCCLIGINELCMRAEILHQWANTELQGCGGG